MRPRKCGDAATEAGLTSGTDEAPAFVGDRVPVPLEELDDDLCRERDEDGEGMG